MSSLTSKIIKRATLSMVSSPLLAPLIILMISIVLRIYNLENRMLWWGDTGRDMFIGYLMVNEGQIPIIGHISGYLNGFYYPPYYYYLVGMIVYFVRSPILTVAVFSLASASLSYVFYLLAASWFSPWVGILTACFIAISSSMIHGANMWSAYVAPIIFYWGMFIFESYTSFFYKIFGLLVMAFAGTIHITLVVVMCFYMFIHLMQRKNRMSVVYGACSVLFCGWLFLPTILVYLNINSKFSPINSPIREGFADHLIDRYLLSAQSLLSEFTRLESLGGYVTGLFVLIMILYPTITIKAIKRQPLFWIVPILPFLSAVRDGEVLAGYVYFSVFPLLYMFISYICVSMWEKSGIQKGIGVMITVLLLFTSTVNFESTLYSGGYFNTAGKITDYIYEHMRGVGNSVDFSIISGQPSENFFWESPIYWYYMASKYKYHNALIINTGENVDLKYRPPFLIHVCKDYSRMTVQDSCINPFEIQYRDYSFVKYIPHPYGDVFIIRLYAKSI